MNGGFILTWPAQLRRTPTRLRWFEKFAALPLDLDLQQVAKRLNEPYATVYRWADAFGYPFPDRRRQGQVSSTQWDQVDWLQRDAHIARGLGVSRERVRQVRAMRGVGPSQQRANVQRFEQWVALNAHRLDGKRVAQIVSVFGVKLSQQVARRILRVQGVRAHDPSSKWRSVDWRLTNRDLADIWRTSPKYIANVRARLGVGAAKWDGRSGRILRDQEYLDAIARERSKTAQPKRRSVPHLVSRT